MTLAANVASGVVAVLHLFFLTLEMFLWQKPLGLRTFRQDAATAATTAVLAKNQGLYNGFLSAGLLWSLVHPDPSVALQLQRFFLGCVVVAGAYGAATVNKRIFFVQAVPALVALALGAL
jgi:putative membrane protein